VSDKATIMLDGNEAAADVAYRLSEAIVIYPITPSSPMGEFSDEWAAKGQPNLWSTVPDVVEMQSEAGAIGACHGAIQAGALSTTFTASQGLLLMIPNLFKIAGELTPFALHVAARSVATHALSIFGDHSDVMACRSCGIGLLSSNSVQEAHDLAAIAHAATLESRIPFLHFFDGFRTSHEVSKIERLSDDTLRALIDQQKVAEFRERALTPDAPKIRGTAQNPDTFFQAREVCNPFYAACPGIVKNVMARFAELTGRTYNLFDYVGAPDAEKVIVIMGSGAETAHETIDHLTDKGEKVGLLKVRLFQPFAAEDFLAALPETTRAINVLDRTKEPGAVGEPMYQTILTTLSEARSEGRSPFKSEPTVIGGRYGLSSKEFTPACVKACFDQLDEARPKNHFTVGIVDDVTHTSIDVDDSFSTEPEDVKRCVFFGLGSDGTVGANKNSIKIIGEETDNFAQGYFVYDSKKSGAVTISHLRFGPRPIRSTYLITEANFVACHQFNMLEKYDVLDYAADGATFLINAPFPADQVWDELPKEVQQQIIDKHLKLYTIDGYEVARETGMGGRINTIMQTCFFAISGVLPPDEAIDKIKGAIKKTYGKKGENIVQANYAAVDAAIENLHEVKVPGKVTSDHSKPPIISEDAPDFVQRVTAVMMANKGDLLPVSAFPPDGTWPTGTTRYEKRAIAQEIPVWEDDICIQCNKCALVCPHACIRAKVYEPEKLAGAPDHFKAVDFKAKDFRGDKFTIQVSPDDCTGCNLCVAVCPGKDKSNPSRKALNMHPMLEAGDTERQRWDFFEGLPHVDREKITRLDVKGSQFFEPLFEFSGACAGCGETPYVKLMTQLFGDRMIIANATGCSSIYGGNLPTTPYCSNDEGRGPAWSNSLFEDNAEFGYGFRIAIDAQRRYATHLMRTLAPKVGDELVQEIEGALDSSEATIQQQRKRVEALRDKLQGIDTPEARALTQVADYLVPKSVWMLGGDGWAYDIGYGGLDHVLSQGRNINIMVLDTEVYSNTGGQASKATPIGAAAKFAAAGKASGKKDLGLMAMSYRNVYIASIAFGANDNHTVKAIQEAEAYPGPSLIIAYSHCIAHGYDLRYGIDQQKKAVGSGIWPLYRYDPRRLDEGLPPLEIDSKPPSLPVSEYMRNETRFRMVEKIDPQRFKNLALEAQRLSAQRVEIYQQLAEISVSQEELEPAAAE